jgi:hypothetical protein
VRQLINAVLRIAPHDGDYRFYSARRAAGLLRACGFRVKEARRLGLWAYVLMSCRHDRVSVLQRTSCR